MHSKETVTSSLPAAIRAGNNITLHGDTENTDSAISAGGTLRMDGALTENAHMQQEQAVTLGTTRGSYTERRNWLHRGKVRKFHSKVYMTPEIVRANPAPIGVHAIEENAAAESVSDAQRNRVARTLSPFGLTSAAQTAGTGTSGAEHISLSALYHVHPESTATHLVETDPAFTDRKKFLSSDYMYQRLKWDPDRIPKRIGDGFYEQQLLADQILKQTGKRHLDGYTDDETAFRALMDAGISYAQEMNLAPGVALSKEQVASLTSDMIWLEEREVYVNGKKERAVYPVLYTKNTQGLRLTKGGSLISARNIIVETKDALKNAGTLYGENIVVQAGEIEHTGRMRAKNIGLKSEHDIDLRGSLVGDKKVVLEAKNNITAESTTEKLAHQDVLNTTTGIAVKGDEGVLVVSAGKNIALAGAALTALGKNGSVLLSAGENIALATKKLQSEKDMTANAENYLRTKRSTELGTEIRADGNISLAAGNDLTARAATIESKSGTASLAAGNDISLTEGRETAEDHYGIRYKSSGLLSSTTTTVRTNAEADAAITSKVTGQNVNIAAKRDATFTAANIAADSDVNIAAGRNFSAVSAENYSHTENVKEVKKSGIFSSGGLGFTIGTQKTKTAHESDAITQQGTNIAALGGNVSIAAGETAHISSSNILAAKDATIAAKETILDGKDNIYRESFTQESRTTGLTVSLGHGLLSLGQEIAAPLQRMGEVKDDRLKAVYAWKAGRLIHENFGKGQNPLKDAAGFSLNLSLGTSKSYSRTESVTREYAGSKIAAGEKADLIATERDLAMQGSTVEGKNVALAAKQNIELLAGENSNHTTSENEASSAGIGISFSPQGLSGLSLHASKAQGNSKENASTYTPTEIAAKDALQIESGKDTNILGSTVQGDKVTAKIGGNLHIETLQEKETYEEKNTSAGFDLSWDIRAGKFSKPTFGLSAGRGTIDSHYRSARGQSGIFAGKDGFDIYVEKNTDLKGAVIASEADAGKNRLSTGTFSFSDLENGADYSAKDYGISVQTQRKRQLTGKIHSETGELEATEVQELNIHPSVSIPLRGHASSTTKSAVAAGAIDIRENPGQDISALDRDMQNTLNELDRIFHRSDIKEKQEWIGILSSEGYRMIGDYSLWHYKEAIKEAAKHEKGSEAYKKAMKEADRWQDGGAYKTMLHASFGGLLSSFSGASFSAGAITGTVNELMIKELQNIKSPELKQAFSLIAGAAIGKMAGDSPWTEAAIAEQATQNNFLIHEYQVKMAYALKEALDSGDHQRILNVVAYFAALSSYSMKHPTRAEQLDWVLLNGPIEPLLLKQLMRIDNPNDSIHASDMINDALNRIVTSTYGWEATLLANLYFSRLENGFYQHDGFTIPDEAFHRLEWEQPRLLQKIYAQEMAKLAATEPKEYVQRVYQNGGYWNDSGILVDNGEERPYFLQRGDYEYQYNHLPIAGHFPDGTPYIRAEKGDETMADWPVWSAPRAEIRNPTQEENANWFWHEHATEGISSFFLGPFNTAKIAITGTDMGGFYVLPGERINAKQEFAMGLITSIIPTGGGALKTLSALKVQNPLLNIIYSPKVIKQMTQDIYHGFPKSVEGFGHYGTTKKIFGNDGIERTLIEIPGTYNGKEGIFEFIIENDGIICNHRFFRVPEK